MTVSVQRTSRWGPAQLLVTLLVCIAAWAVVATLCLCIGSTELGWPAARTLHLRADSVLIASLVGAALGVAGVTYQAVLRNPWPIRIFSASAVARALPSTSGPLCSEAHRLFWEV